MAEFLKCFLPCVLFFVTFCLMTLQKTSLIVSLRLVLQQNVSVENGYALLTTLLVMPYLFSLLLVLWNVPFLRRSQAYSLPSARHIVLGVFSAIVEAVCVVMFTTRVMTILPVFVALPASHGVLAISAVISAFNKGKKRTASLNISGCDTKPSEEKSFLCMGARITASITCTLVSPAAGCFLYVMNLSDLVTAVSLGVIPLLLGLIWNPDLQSHVLDPSGNNPLCHRRLHLLYGVVKVVSLVFFILVEMYFRSDISQTHHFFERYAYGFFVFQRPEVCLAIAVHFLTSLIGFGFSYASLALCQPTFGVVLPSLFSMVSSLVLCVTLSPSLYGIDETTFFGSFSPFLICASILAWAWAWPYILNASAFLMKPPCLLTPYQILFKSFGWNPVFHDQRFLLDYDPSNPSETAFTNFRIKNRIYICTTMYREADYEMARLLESLMNISADPLLKGIHFESNIFMDNGCSGTKLNEFALQFVALLITRGGVSLDKARCWATPYGLQIFCQLPSGLPMFVHLKDPQKVKSKKRWSQAMYINYVMRFRKSLWKNDSENKPFIAENRAVPEIRVSGEGDAPDVIHYVGHDEQFMLRQISNIGYPTLADFTSATVGKVRQCPSAEDSSPPHSEAGSQCPVSGSSKESSDLDSLPDEKQRYYHGGAYVNSGYQTEDSICSAGNEEKSEVQQTTTAPFCDSIAFAKVTPTYTDVIADSSAYVDDDHTFILATDADMDFKAGAIKELLDLCISDKRIGAACGRTHPIGQKCSSIVWHQVFEYAKDFWMIKNAQNIIGSVSCCPGCFSLYRANAIKDVMDKYASPTRTPFTVYVKDTGEDRWMATLMMISGWRMRYSPFAGNTTYCPDTFEEYYKQRRRWILSDMANAILVVQNLLRLVRNNECFSLMYVIYLVNMFLNNVITPGTAIVMITAGLELVFEIPYVYTTLPMALVVYLYAFICTCTSARTQGLLTSILMVLFGSMFSSVAIYGSYKITAGMVQEIQAGHFHFQQHYVILLLTLSLVYAAMMHPSESYQIIYGFAYLFIFPAMHVLLPIYSIANIIDQSWGTRDSNEAKLPKISCLPSFKKMKKRSKSSKAAKTDGDHRENETDTQNEIQTLLSTLVKDMSQGDEKAREENKFWDCLIATHLGTSVNQGLEKAELAEGLGRLRNRLLAGFLFLNALWLGFLSYFYMGLDTPLSRLNIYGIISGALYGFTLIIQILGLTAGRIEQMLRKLAKYVHKEDAPVWVHERENSSK